MATLTPPTGWRFAWLDEIPDGAAFRFHAEDKDRAAEDRKAQRPHSLVIIPLPCPTCGGTGRATDQPNEDLLDAERIEGTVLDAVHKVDGTCELVIEVPEAEYGDHLGMPVAVLPMVAADQPTEVAGDG